MNMPEPLNALCIRLAITLAHFIWQGATVALLAALAGLLLRKSAPTVRYRVFLAALAIVAACPVVTFLLVPDQTVDGASAAPRPVLPSGATITIVSPPPAMPVAPRLSGTFEPPTEPMPAPAAVQTVEPTRPAAAGSADYFRRLSPIAAGAYALGVLAMLARLLAGLHGGMRLRRTSEPADDPALLAMFARQARSLGLRLTPAIACCGRVAVPIVVGLIRPMILLPMSMSAGLSPSQVEAVLAHELAHIRRLDPLVNVLQRIVESMLFYHPGVWFISRRICVERENCCDDLAVAAGAERLAYAESLLQIARRSMAESRAVRGRAAVGVGATDKPSLLRTRIRRLLGGPEERIRLGRTWPVATLLIAAVLAATALLNLRAESAGTADPNASAPAAKDRPPATKPAQPAEFIRRVYDVRDLIVPVPDFPGLEYWDLFDPNAIKGSPADKRRAQWREAEAKKLMDRLIEQIKGIDPESWRFDAWRDHGTIDMLNGALVISQTRANHGRIEKLIAALRSKKTVQVLVATRFIEGLSIPAGAKDDALSAWLGKNVKARLDEKTGLLPLSADQARSLLEFVSGPNRGIDVKLLMAPRMTLSNKQRAYVVVCRGEATLLPSLDKDGNTVLVAIPTGACLDIKPTIDPDYKSIACQLHAWKAENASDVKTPIMVVQAETRADFRVPDKGAMLLRMEQVKHVVDGARQVTDPNGVVKVEVRHKPVETSGQAKEYVYVLLQPEIIVNEAAERDEAVSPNPKGQPAPATHPAEAETRPAQPAEMIQRVYDVRDLTAPVLDFPSRHYRSLPGPGIFDELEGKPTPESKRRAEKAEAEQKRLTDQLIERVRQIDPDSWSDRVPADQRGSIRMLKGAMVIAQTKANHDRISKLIGAERRKLGQVLVYTRFLKGPAVPAGAKDDALSAWLAKNIKAPLDEKTGLLELTDDQAKALVEYVQTLDDANAIAAPRITLINGQRAYVTLGRQEAAFVPRLDKPGEKALVHLAFGSVIDIKTTIDANAGAVVCQLRASAAERAFQGDTPGGALAEKSADFRVPDKAVMLLRMEEVTEEIEGARAVANPADPNGAPRVEAQYKRVRTANQPKQYVYVLIQPEILSEKSEEAWIADRDVPRLALADPNSAAEKANLRAGLNCKARPIQPKLPFNRQPQFEVTLTNVSAKPIDLIATAENPAGPAGAVYHPCASLVINTPGPTYFILPEDSAQTNAKAVRIEPGKSWSFTYPTLTAGATFADGDMPSLSALMPDKYRAEICYSVRKDVEQQRLGDKLVYDESAGSLAGKKPAKLWNGTVSAELTTFEVTDDHSPQLAILRDLRTGAGLDNLRMELDKTAVNKDANVQPLGLRVHNTGDRPIYLGSNFGLVTTGPDGKDFADFSGPRSGTATKLEPNSHLDLGGWSIRLTDRPPGTYVMRAEYVSPAGDGKVLAKSNEVRIGVPATQPASATTEPKDVHAAVRIEAAKVMLDQAKAKLADVQKAVENHNASDNDLARAQREIALDEIGVKLAEAEARGDRAEDAKLRVQAAAVDKQYKDRILANVEKAAKSGAAAEGELEEARLDAKIAEFGLLLAKAQQAGDAVEVQRLRVQAAQVSRADKQRKLARVEALQKRNAATEDQVLDARTDVKVAELSLRDEQASLDEVQKRALPATQPADAATSQNSQAKAKIEAAKAELKKAETELAAVRRPGMRPKSSVRDAVYRVAMATIALAIAEAEANGHQAATATLRVELAKVELAMAKSQLADIKERADRNGGAADREVQDAEHAVSQAAAQLRRASAEAARSKVPAPSTTSGPNTQPAWGEPANGFSIRLRPAEPPMRPDGWPDFRVDFRNAAKRKLEVVFAPESIRFEADGVWYRSTVILLGEDPVFTIGPGEDHLGVPFWPATHWQWRSDTGAALPTIKPGKHTFRLAFRHHPEAGTGGKPVEVVSQMLEALIPGPATQPAVGGRGKHVDIDRWEVDEQGDWPSGKVVKGAGKPFGIEGDVYAFDPAEPKLRKTIKVAKGYAGVAVGGLEFMNQDGHPRVDIAFQFLQGKTMGGALFEIALLDDKSRELGIARVLELRNRDLPKYISGSAVVGGPDPPNRSGKAELRFLQIDLSKAAISSYRLRVADAAKPLLARLLADTDSYVRQCAVRGLGQLGKEASDSLPAMKGLLLDHDEAVRTAAQEAVERVEKALAQPATQPATKPAQDAEANHPEVIKTVSVDVRAGKNDTLAI